MILKTYRQKYFNHLFILKKIYNIGTAESVNRDITVNQTVALQSLDPNELNICFLKALRVRIYDFYFTFAFAFFFPRAAQNQIHWDLL